MLSADILAPRDEFPSRFCSNQLPSKGVTQNENDKKVLLEKLASIFS